ncbi:MAG: hypothetical protein H7039_03900, partial [Bryobacteraceae bacterium]|nr:hypothetical protein [Bryobacteraceae bacterium]
VANTREAFGIPDPDVTTIQIVVEIKTLQLDNLQSLSGKEPYIVLYKTTRAFDADDFNQARVIPLEFVDAHVLRSDDLTFGDLGVTQAELDAGDALILPRARDIRLTIRALAGDDPAYFAKGANVGKTIQLNVRREGLNETELLGRVTGVLPLRGIYLQPDPPPAFDGEFSSLFFERPSGTNPGIVQRLAQQLGVDQKGLTFTGKRGERVIFGCSRRIRHTMAPDHSSLTLAAKEDLMNHWLVVLKFELRRDWTWDGLKHVAFDIFRTQRFQADAVGDDNGGQPVGDWEIPRSVPLLALDQARRESTTLIYIDAVEPKSERPQPGNPGETQFPDLIELTYRVEPRFRTAPENEDDPEGLELELPVTTPPSQVPRLASAGVALSKYERADDYSSTEARKRFLWLEFEQPVRDPNDAYFIRMLGVAPDPMLSDNRFETFLAPEGSPLAIDPEWIRMIASDQPDDNAGLSAMVQLVPSDTSDRHFLIPLPPGLNPDSPELFGFFTYELRVGHANIWSTAQGRFGRALKTTGVQHPAPTLYCTCTRTETKLTVEAPYSEAVFNGKNITANPPRTEIWALLYAQVRQADGKDFRNVLLGERRLAFRPRLSGRLKLTGASITAPFENVDSTARGITAWEQGEILSMLRELGLPDDASLSVLCVEMLPTQRVQAASASTALLPTSQVESDARPLSDDLGHHRILRSSPLTPAPAICCPNC